MNFSNAARFQFFLGATEICVCVYNFSSTGKAEGVLFEDAGDGYEFTEGGYLLTHYEAELQSSIVTIKVAKTEGSWKRPKRGLHVHLLLGGGARVCLCYLVQ